MNLTSGEYSLLLEVLEYARHNFENYQKYPSYEFKQKRIDEINRLILKIKEENTK